MISLGKVQNLSGPAKRNGPHTFKYNDGESLSLTAIHLVGVTVYYGRTYSFIILQKWVFKTFKLWLLLAKSSFCLCSKHTADRLLFLFFFICSWIGNSMIFSDSPSSVVGKTTLSFSTCQKLFFCNFYHLDLPTFNMADGFTGPTVWDSSITLRWKDGKLWTDKF